MALSDQDVVTAIVGQLRAQLPGLVAAAGLRRVTAILDYDPAHPDPAKTPLVWVDLTADRRSDAGSRGATLHKYSHQPTLIVGIWVAGQDESAAVAELRQLTHLVRQAVEADQAAAGLWVRWQQTVYSPNLAKGISGLFKEAVLTFDVNHRTRAGQE